MKSFELTLLCMCTWVQYRKTGSKRFYVQLNGMIFFIEKEHFVKKGNYLGFKKFSAQLFNKLSRKRMFMFIIVEDNKMKTTGTIGIQCR